MLQAFTAGLLLITISELGDKTFFIAAILAMRHPRRLVFIGVLSALAAMTILSVLIGQAASIFPDIYIHYAEIALFLGFGLKLLYDAAQMSPQAECSEAKEAIAAIEEAQAPPLETHRKSQVLSFPWLASAQLGILSQAFGLTFLGEWGDRTQIATITLAASNHPAGVTAGAILGHGICAAIAVLGGRLIAGRISERMVTALGGFLFLIFGFVAALQGA